ncbi:MAG: AMP-binding protein [Myxococcales bacterium]|nr:AMP-binding protein [Myxococcales bacterium]
MEQVLNNSVSTDAAAPTKVLLDPSQVVSEKPRSVAEMLLRRIERSAALTAFQFPDESRESGWQTMTWRQVGDQVRYVAAALHSLGLELEDRVGILCSTRIEWILADFGATCAGGATTTIYPNSTPDDCQYILSDSNARVVFAETAEHVDFLLKKRTEMSTLELVVTIDGQRTDDGWVVTLDDFLALGQAYDQEHPNVFFQRIQAIESHHLATLIYTSGTTGRPKGVELIHDCWVFKGKTMAELGLADMNDHHYLWLPLSHSFGKVLQVYQLEVGFPTTVDGRVHKLVENLAVVRPTILAAAPRIFEKVYNRVLSGATETWIKKQIFGWATGVGREVSYRRQQKRKLGVRLSLAYSLATRLVFSKLQARFGGRLRFFVSGSAALSKEIGEFFHGAGLMILEGYGLTETSAASLVNRPESLAFGTVGMPLSGVEVKIDPHDGEILIRGRGVMRAYHNLPETTAEVLGADGWFRTGDIGEFDGAGRLKITDRKKDLIKTSGGKYVAPQKIEGLFKAVCPYVSQIVVHGNGRNFCSALVTLDEDTISTWATEHGLSGLTVAELAKTDQVQALIQKDFDELNGRLARHETVKKFAILSQDFSELTGELTASLKVKRKFVADKHRDILQSFYVDAIHKA